jgi:hypothetical protein
MNYGLTDRVFETDRMFTELFDDLQRQRIIPTPTGARR